jgi:hypothetical protein
MFTLGKDTFFMHPLPRTLVFMKRKVSTLQAGVIFADAEVVPGLKVGFERGVIKKEGGVCRVGLG